VGAQPDEDPGQPDDSRIKWIHRETPPYEPVAPAAEPPRGSALDYLRDRRGRWIVAGVAALLLFAVAAILWSTRSSSPVPGTPAGQSEPPPLVSVAVPGLRPVTSRVTFTGTIAARHDMPISAEGEGGRIVAVLVDIGDRVKRGQVLARLDSSVLREQVKRLEASLEEARAQAALSAAEYERAQGVEAAGALSKEEIARRRAASLTDEARVRVAEAQLAEARARLWKTDIRAPDDGVVLTRNAEVGQMAVAGGEPLFRLARGGEVEMRGQVAERDLAALAVGQPAHVYLTGIAEPFEGSVRLLGAVIDPVTRLGEIRIALSPHPALRPGAFARGQVVVNRAERPVLPQTAVLSDAKGTYVYIVNGEEKVERVTVRVESTIPEGIVIAEGLTGSERVVTTAGGFLRPGERVQVLEQETGAS